MRHWSYAHQDAFQIFFLIQRQNHIWNNIPWGCCFLVISPQTFFAVTPYKDPAETHLMEKISDKIITGFFVFIFGVLWYFSVRYYVKPHQYSIIVYDLLGNESKLDGIRTDFKIRRVAISHVREYRNRFSHYDFYIRENIPEIGKRTVFSKISRIQK